MNRSVDERVRDVTRWLEAARDVYQRRGELAPAIARSTGLSPEGVALGFDSLERDATPAELRELVARAGDATHVHVILSANVFVAPLRAIAMARAASGRVTVRPSPRDPTLTRALVAAANDAAVSIVDERDPAALEADRIDVYGRDETIAHVRSAARPGVTVRGHGAGLGVAFVSLPSSVSPASLAHGGMGAPEPLGAIDAAAEALAADVVPFDQRGCLSPRLALVEGTVAEAEAFAAALSDRLAAWGARVPRGSLGEEERAESVRWGEALAFAGRVWRGEHHVVGLASPGMPLAIPPAGRHVLVVPIASVPEARVLLATIERFVVTVAANAPERLAAVAPPGARHARLGQMQRPGLDGPVDRRLL
jgi:Acyl-CoA reductase (LuxC)